MGRMRSIEDSEDIDDDTKPIEKHLLGEAVNHAETLLANDAEDIKFKFPEVDEISQHKSSQCLRSYKPQDMSRNSSPQDMSRNCQPQGMLRGSEKLSSSSNDSAYSSGSSEPPLSPGASNTATYVNMLELSHMGLQSTTRRGESQCSSSGMSSNSSILR